MNAYQINNQNEIAKIIKLRDAEHISPLKKYKYAGIFPTTLLLHIFAAILSACQILFVVTKTTDYARSQEFVFLNNFISDDAKEGGDFARTQYIFSISGVRDKVRQSINNFYSLPKNSLEKFEIDNKPILLEFNFFNEEDRRSSKANSGEIAKVEEIYTSNAIYEISKQSIGPFELGNQELREFISEVRSFKIVYGIKSFLPQTQSHVMPECVDWEIKQLFDIDDRANAVVSLALNRKSCLVNDTIAITNSKLRWLHFTSLLCSGVSLLLAIRYISKVAQVYVKAKKQTQNREDSSISRTEDSEYYNPLITYSEDHPLNTEEDVYHNHDMENDLSDKDSFSKIGHDSNSSSEDSRVIDPNAPTAPSFNLGWSSICITGNLFIIFGSITYLTINTINQTTVEYFLGLGVLFSFINLGRYLEYNVDYASIFYTASFATPTVIRYLLGVAPIFLGFMFLGSAIFWQSENFTSPSAVFMTLFSLSQGDSTLDILKDLGSISYFLGYIYICAFCLFFFAIVMNIFIAIIEDAFVIDKMKNKTHWIFNYISKVQPTNLKPKFNLIERKLSSNIAAVPDQLTKVSKYLYSVS